MKPLSEQLSDLADRAKQAEDTVYAAEAKNRTALQSQRERLKLIDSRRHHEGPGRHHCRPRRNAVMVGRDSLEHP